MGGLYQAAALCLTSYVHIRKEGFRVSVNTSIYIKTGIVLHVLLQVVLVGDGVRWQLCKK